MTFKCLLKTTKARGRSSSSKPPGTSSSKRTNQKNSRFYYIPSSQQQQSIQWKPKFTLLLHGLTKVTQAAFSTFGIVTSAAFSTCAIGARAILNTCATVIRAIWSPFGFLARPVLTTFAALTRRLCRLLPWCLFLALASYTMYLLATKKGPPTTPKTYRYLSDPNDSIIKVSREFRPLKYRLPVQLKTRKFVWDSLPCRASNNSPNSYVGTTQIQKGNVTTPIFVRDSYVFVPNYIKAYQQFRCNQSITFTTHGGLNFMDNLVPVVERWEGPVSVAFHAPGTDFFETVQRIQYLRLCTSELMRKLVTFHLFFELKYLGQTLIPSPEAVKANCSSPPSFSPTVKSFRALKKLTYPVNVARNLARTEATTYYVLAADIELYPSPRIIPMFLDFIARRERYERWLYKSNRKAWKRERTPPHEVYMVPVFEIKEDTTLPNSKDDLEHYLATGVALPFHYSLCYDCHWIPGLATWRKRRPRRTLNAILRLRRYGYTWEPVYIGTNKDPLFPEKLTWEGQRNKVMQIYELCLMKYFFALLDNAFLVHRPGIRKISGNKRFTSQIIKQNAEIKRLRKEMIKRHGNTSGCWLQLSA